MFVSTGRLIVGDGILTVSLESVCTGVVCATPKSVLLGWIVTLSDCPCLFGALEFSVTASTESITLLEAMRC